MATYWENSCSFGLRYVSWYKYLIVSLVFSHLGFWSGNLFLIAPFPDLCLLVPFSFYQTIWRYIQAGLWKANCIDVLLWPAISPDLSPIEHSLQKMRVRLDACKTDFSPPEISYY